MGFGTEQNLQLNWDNAINIDNCWLQRTFTLGIVFTSSPFIYLRATHGWSGAASENSILSTFHHCYLLCTQGLQGSAGAKSHPGQVTSLFQGCREIYLFYINSPTHTSMWSSWSSQVAFLRVSGVGGGNQEVTGRTCKKKPDWLHGRESNLWPSCCQVRRHCTTMSLLLPYPQVSPDG